MGQKAKNGGNRSTSTIDLGRVRKKRINLYRAQEEVKGTEYRTIDDAVNALLDKALDLEKV